MPGSVYEEAIEISLRATLPFLHDMHGEGKYKIEIA